MKKRDYSRNVKDKKVETITYLNVNTGVSIRYGYKFSMALSGLMYKYDYYKHQKLEVFTENDDYFYITQYDFLLLTGLGFKEQLKVLKEMVQMKLIRIKHVGTRQIRYIYLYPDRVKKLIKKNDLLFKEIRSKGIQKSLVRNNLPTLNKAIDDYLESKSIPKENGNTETNSLKEQGLIPTGNITIKDTTNQLTNNKEDFLDSEELNIFLEEFVS